MEIPSLFLIVFFYNIAVWKFSDVPILILRKCLQYVNLQNETKHIFYGFIQNLFSNENETILLIILSKVCILL